MNKRIQTLADQAKKNVPHGLLPDKWIEVYNEKFAELVVRESVYLFGITRTEPSLEKFILDKLGIEK
jgi:hypothetical protein